MKYLDCVARCKKRALTRCEHRCSRTPKPAERDTRRDAIILTEQLRQMRDALSR